ncbi:MAG: ComEC/Rec2 family competence protein [Anaerolineae bacterium]|nr:ComEC/Rec2 family competence protein [Anaerolineae bacterium]
MRLIYIVFGWITGILIAAAIPTLPAIFWLISITVTAFVTVLMWRHRYRLMWLVLLAVALGGYRMQLVPRPGTVAYFNDGLQAVQVEGLVVGEPRFRDNRTDMRVEAESLFNGQNTFRVTGLLLATVDGRFDIAYGDRVRLSGYLSTPARYDTFSYADYLARSSVFSVMQDARLEIVGHGEGASLLSAILTLKDTARLRIDAALPDPSAALLKGILLGDESGIDPQLRDDFSIAGASHVIAISGFNMVIVSGIVMQLMGQLTSRRWLAGTLGILVLVAYTIFVGANAAVVRAALMSSLLIIAPLLRRKTYVPASLAFVILLMTVINPLTVWDIGFQLSAAAVLGLALFADPLQTRFDSLVGRIFPSNAATLLARTLRDPLIVTLAVQITTLPITILYFQQISLVMFIVNLLIVPVQTALLIIGGLALIIALVAPIIALPFFWICGLLLGWTIGIVRLFANWPGAALPLYVDPRLIVGYFFIVVGGALIVSAKPLWSVRLAAFLRRRIVLNTLIWGSLGAICLMVAVMISRPDGRFHLWMLDVGHSNAILMQTPSGAQILVDGGSQPSRLLTALGDRMPFYDREIELLVVSHPDGNDIGALPSVMRRYQVGAILTNGHPIVTEVQQEIVDLAGDVPVVPAVAGYTVSFADGVLIEVLHPSQPPQAGDLYNDDSLVLRLSYNELSLLLTNDISAPGQGVLLERGQWPAAAVMIVPNHARIGAIADDFLEAVNPQLALMQIERANRWGDPDGGSLAQLEDIPLYSTDSFGPIHLISDGTTIWINQD